VLEKRRLDTSFESLDQPQCPLLAEEERYRIGIENKQKKAYRKKCLGRLRKQLADYAMLSGLPAVALDHYQKAAEQLKSVGDLLWLAAAYEGWAVAAITMEFAEKAEKIIDKLKSAIENYTRFSFVALVEFECVLRVAYVYQYQRMYIETEVSL
jgi:tetratricopeptide (TPR) repeat protein